MDNGMWRKEKESQSWRLMTPDGYELRVWADHIPLIYDGTAVHPRWFYEVRRGAAQIGGGMARSVDDAMNDALSIAARAARAAQR